MRFPVVPFRRPRPGRRKVGKIKINVKGNGQECPFHICKGKIKIKVKGKRAGARALHGRE